MPTQAGTSCIVSHLLPLHIYTDITFSIAKAFVQRLLQIFSIAETKGPGLQKALVQGNKANVFAYPLTLFPVACRITGVDL